MRLKQLLGFSLPLILCAVCAAAPVTQLTELRVQSQGSGTTVSIQANGAFTHTEYRPADGLLLVDLPGVLPGHYANQNSTVNAGGVQAYRVHTFRGASGDETTRVEITLAAHCVVTVDKKANTLLVQVSGTAAQNSSLPAANQTLQKVSTSANTEESARVETHASTGRPAIISNVSVKRSVGGMDVEVKLDRALTPKVLKLTNPDRIVLDLPGAVSTTQKRNFSVNSDLVKSVRMARDQISPPVTRIVVDLVTPSNYEIASAGNGFAVHLTPVTAGATATVSEAQIAETRAANTASKKIVSADTVGTTTANTANIAANATEVASNHTVANNSTETAANSKIADVAPAQNASINQGLFKLDGSQTAVLGTPTRADAAAAHFASAASTTIPLSNLGTQPNAILQPATLPMQIAPDTGSSVNAAPTSCSSNRYTGEPISLNLKEADLRDFFRLVHEISGLNVVLDPDVKGTLTIVLDDVPWDQALAIVLRNNRLDCELQGNVLRIASTDTIRREADSRRAQVEALAQSVDKITVNRYLSYANAAEAKATLTAFLSPRGNIVVDKRTNSLIISDIPNSIPNIDRLLKELDRKTPEVEIEARVVSTSRSFARDIGTQVGFGWGNGASAIGGTAGQNPSPLQVNHLNPFYILNSSGNSIPLFSNHPATNITDGLSFINATNNYRIDFLLSMSETKGLAKILSRPRVVTQNNSPAIIRQGQQIPIVTQGQLGGPPTTTYISAFLRLQVTPQITADGTIFLSIDVENTTADFTQEVLNNPTLNTQQATTQVLVSNGGTVMIGGVVQTNSSVNVDQFPILGDIPILGNLFKHRSVRTNTAELIFFITPKIING